jgi:hypothetical protein
MHKVFSCFAEDKNLKIAVIAVISRMMNMLRKKVHHGK